MTPPSRPTFEIKAEREISSSALDGPDELGLEFELEWRDGEDRSDDGDLTIGYRSGRSTSGTGVATSA